MKTTTKLTWSYIILVAYVLFKISFGGGEILKPSINQKYLYVFDSGHGYDSQCAGKAFLEDDGNCFYEWKFNWDVRYYLCSMLDSIGINYELTNTNEDFHRDISLSERVHRVNRIADTSSLEVVLISIHANAASEDSDNFEGAEGFEVYSPSKSLSNEPYENRTAFSDSIALTMYNLWDSTLVGHELRGSSFKTANFTMLTKPNCYSILTENGFFTNERERNLMKTEKFKKKVANFHFKLIKILENI